MNYKVNYAASLCGSYVAAFCRLNHNLLESKASPSRSVKKNAQFCRLNPRSESLENEILPIKKPGVAENLDLNLGKNSIKRTAKAQSVLNLRIDLSRRILPRRVNFKICGDEI